MTTTLVIVFLTTIIIGASTYPVLNWLKLTKEYDVSAPLSRLLLHCSAVVVPCAY